MSELIVSDFPSLVLLAYHGVDSQRQRLGIVVLMHYFAATAVATTDSPFLAGRPLSKVKKISAAELSQAC